LLLESLSYYIFNDLFSVLGFAGMSMTSANSSSEGARAPGRSYAASNAAEAADMRRSSRPPGLLRRFLCHNGGNPLIQFALVAPVFLGLVFIILDEGLMIFTQATLDNATRDASRNILLGTYQQNGSGDAANLGTFKTAVCNEMGGLIPSCTSNLQVYVNNAASFSSLSAQSGSGGALANNGTFSICQTADCPSSGASGVSRHVIVQTAYNRPYIPDIVGYFPGTNLLLISTIVFQAEPYK
jgi:Flp pilus assembly protein TadG